MKRIGTTLSVNLRGYLLTLDNNTIYEALFNQGHGKTENAYWKGITTMRAEPDHRWNSTWLNMWDKVPEEVRKLAPKFKGDISSSLLEGALQDPEVQAAIKKFAELTKEIRLLQTIREEVEKKVRYLHTFSAFPIENLRAAVYTCLYVHCPFKVPPEGKDKLVRLVADGQGESFLALVKKFNEWKPIPLEFS